MNACAILTTCSPDALSDTLIMIVMFRITDPTLSPSPPETFRRCIVDHQHYQSYTPFFCPDNSRLGPSPPAPYHKRNHHYPILQHFTCQWAPSNTCIIIQHLRLRLRTEQIPYDSIYFTTRIFHFTICLFHITMQFFIFDIPFSMCSLPYYKLLCFSFYYLNIEYLSCHSQF